MDQSLARTKLFHAETSAFLFISMNAAGPTLKSNRRVSSRQGKVFSTSTAEGLTDTTEIPVNIAPRESEQDEVVQLVNGELEMRSATRLGDLHVQVGADN